MGIFQNAVQFDPQINGWTSLPSLKVGRLGHGQATLNGKIYVAGGLNSNDDILNSMEIYNPRTQNMYVKA